MAERSASGTDLAVQELRKKARRRLVGAIVLALAAAVILPLLLEKEPKPLGDDVSVQIPPIDEGKFVNRLTGRASENRTPPKAAAKTDAKPEPRPEPVPETKPEASPNAAAPAVTSAPETVATTAPPAAPEARKSVSEAEQRLLSPSTKATTKTDAGKAPKPEVPEMRAAPEPVVAAVPPQVAPAPPAPAPVPAASSTAPTTAATTTAANAPAAATPKPEAFAVQIAAFTDDKGANALAGKLKKAGFASTYVEPVQTSRGTLWRVRVGGYPARADADAARAKLKADGWNGIVVSVK